MLTLERVTRRTAEMQFVFGNWAQGGTERTVGWFVARDGRQVSPIYPRKRDAQKALASRQGVG
jgi:hypothetical protein